MPLSKQLPDAPHSAVACSYTCGCLTWLQRHAAQPGRHQHQGRMAVWKCPYYPGSAPDFLQEPFHGIVALDFKPMLRRVHIKRKRLVYSAVHQGRGGVHGFSAKACRPGPALRNHPSRPPRRPPSAIQIPGLSQTAFLIRPR